MSFLRFLLLLPKLITALVEVYKIFKDAEVQKWMNDLEDAIKASKEATNAEDKRLAAIKLASVMRKL